MTMRGLARTVPQRLGMLVAAVASICLVAYPAPAFYRWSESESGWYRTSPPEFNPSSYSYRNAARLAEEQRQFKEDLTRSFIFDYGLYGRRRPDFRRMALEVAFAWLIGIGFAWAVKSSLVSSTSIFFHTS